VKSLPHVATFGARKVIGGGRAGNVLFLAGGAPAALAHRLMGVPAPAKSWPGGRSRAARGRSLTPHSPASNDTA